LTIFHTCTPQPPLSAFVNFFWHHETQAPPHARERRLPNGTMELVIPLHSKGVLVYDRQHPDRSQHFRSGLISGAYSEFCIIDTASLVAVMGINFKPGGSFPFLTLPASELHNQPISLDTLWGAAAVDLHEQLLAAAMPEQRFHILERFLLTLLMRSREIHPAATFALSTFQHGPSIISAVTEQIGLSPKRFIQIFSETVGLTPKQFCRIQRFQEVLRLLEGDHNEPIRWVDIALSCGYFDQAHFNHDFRAFSGLNPGAYLVKRGSHHNHVPL
jgi:AraC-like DNA-binding protein